MPVPELEGYSFCEHQLTRRTPSLTLGNMPVGSLVGRDGLCTQGLLARTIGMVASNRATLGANKSLGAFEIEMDIRS